MHPEHNFIRPSNAGDDKTPHTTKQKLDPLDNPLLQIDNDMKDNTSLSNPTTDKTTPIL